MSDTIKEHIEFLDDIAKTVPSEPWPDCYVHVSRDRMGEIASALRRAERLEKVVEGVRIAHGVLENAPELNMSNYFHDDVARLNTAMVEVWQIVWSTLSALDQEQA
jgi:hypothetical protein